MYVVTAFPRLHVGLLDLGAATFRRYGGLGLALEGPPLAVYVQSSGEYGLRGVEQLDGAAQLEIEQALGKLFEFIGPQSIQIRVARFPPQHVGLGTKTALILAALTAACLAAGVELSPEQFQLMSGRGGTSGVGIHTFFHGGLVADAGHRAAPAGSFLPSSAQRPAAVPPMVAAARVPSDWLFILILPANGIRLHGQDEANFFRSNTPIPRDEILRAIALTYHGLVPAVLENDLSTFREALHAFQDTGFKRREIAGQSEDTRLLLGRLRRETMAAVGMSSLGPLIFAVCRSSDRITAEKARTIANLEGASVLGEHQARNEGFQAQVWR